MNNILLDLDGTLTDPYVGITESIRYALESLDIKVPQGLSWCIGPPLRDSFMRLIDGCEGVTDKTADEAVALYRVRFSREGLYENRVYDGIKEVLEELVKSQKNLYLATSKPWVYAEKILEHFELNGFFKKIYGSELDGTGTDKSDLIKYILNQEGLNPCECVMVGDRKYDLIGAKSNGVRAVAASWGYGSFEEIEEEKPEKICEKPSDLLRYLLLRQ